jgi:DNA (cytosine-5)-methyltransferase 1
MTPAGTPTPHAEKMLTVGSLFSGIGGLELGLEMTGRFKTVWQVEQNEYCRKVLARHWPDATRFEDVRNVGKENLAPVDVICGGFPCQDISSAGKREGIREGNRSGLWFEYARIVRELRPRYVIVENVSALLSDGLGIVLGDLASIGYDADWQVLSAAGVGAPHLRERVFVVAYAADNRVGRRFQFPQGGESPGSLANSPKLLRDVGDHHPRSREERWQSVPESGNRSRATNVRHAASAGLPDWSGGEMGQPCPVTESERPSGREVERDFRGMAHGVSRRVDRLRALGNAVVPACAKVVGEWLLEIDRELAEGAA